MKARNITSTDIILLQCLGNFFFFFKLVKYLYKKAIHRISFKTFLLIFKGAQKREMENTICWLRWPQVTR